MSLNNIEENIGANVSIFECVCSGSNPQMSPFFSIYVANVSVFQCVVVQMSPFIGQQWCKCQCLHFLVSSGANFSIFLLVVVQMSPFFVCSGKNVSIFQLVLVQMSPFFYFIRMHIAQHMSPFLSVQCCKCFHFCISSGANESVFELVVVQMNPFLSQQWCK